MIGKFRVWDGKEQKMYDKAPNVNGLNNYFIDLEGRLCEELGYEGIWEIYNDRPFNKMHYTGMPDINNKEMCEGDIIEIGEPQVENKPRAEIIFMHASFGFISPWGSGEDHFLSLSAYPSDLFQNGFRILGNKFENPELLKKGDTND